MRRYLVNEKIFKEGNDYEGTKILRVRFNYPMAIKG